MDSGTNYSDLAAAAGLYYQQHERSLQQIHYDAPTTSHVRQNTQSSELSVTCGENVTVKASSSSSGLGQAAASAAGSASVTTQGKETAGCGERSRKTKDFLCTICHHQFSRHAVFLQHLRCHGKRRPHACQQCDKTFIERHHLKAHEQAVHSAGGVKMFACAACEQRFSRRSSMIRHLRKTHPGVDIPSTAADMDTAGLYSSNGAMANNIRTDGVNRMRNAYAENKHRSVHNKPGMHGFNGGMHSLSSGVHHLRNPCSHPAPVPSSSQSIVNEEGAAEPPYVMYSTASQCVELICPVCCRVLSNRDSLRRHAKVHDVASRVRCGMCDKTYASAYSLNVHVDSYHRNIRNHACDACDKTFYNPTHLANHKIAVHSDVKNFVCLTCDKAFKLKKLLQKHERSHRAIIHSCVACRKTFADRQTLAYHVIIEHGAAIPQPQQQHLQQLQQHHHIQQHPMKSHKRASHLCPDCGASFTRNDSLRRHRGTQHGIALPDAAPTSNTDGDEMGSKAYERQDVVRMT